MAVAACSREEPVPKLKPPTKMSPFFAQNIGLALGFVHIVCLLFCYLSNNVYKVGVIVLHDDLAHIVRRHVVIVGIFTGIDTVGVEVVGMAEQQFAADHRREVGQDLSRLAGAAAIVCRSGRRGFDRVLWCRWNCGGRLAFKGNR